VKRLSFAVALLAAGVFAASASAADDLKAQSHVSPGPHLFGDRIVVVIDAMVDSRRVDPESVRAEASFAPYERFGKPSRRQTSAGHVVRVTFRYPVACLSLDCVPEAQGAVLTEKRIAFASARVSYVNRKGKRRVVKLGMPEIRLVSRAPEDVRAAANSSFRDPIVQLRAPTRTLHSSYRAEPTLLGSIFLGSAALVFAAALRLGWPALLRTYGILRPVVTAPPLTPLEEALARVEEASDREAGSGAHREALARLMRELRAHDLDELVEPARRLAWSAESPTAASSRELSDRVRRAMAVRS
jgi:hypothetical protein